VRFGAEEHDLPVEALLPQCFGGFAAGHAGPDDDEGVRCSHDGCLS
jgi:hypothetical protein